MVQPASRQTQIFQKTRETDVARRGETVQRRADGELINYVIIIYYTILVCTQFIHTPPPGTYILILIYHVRATVTATVELQVVAEAYAQKIKIKYESHRIAYKKKKKTIIIIKVKIKH